jgi:hypothetical protein
MQTGSSKLIKQVGITPETIPPAMLRGGQGLDSFGLEPALHTHRRYPRLRSSEHVIAPGLLSSVSDRPPTRPVHTNALKY